MAPSDKLTVDSNEEKQEGEEGSGIVWSGGIGGLVRSLSRSTPLFLRTMTASSLRRGLGRPIMLPKRGLVLPKTFNGKAVSSSADAMSNLFDIRNHFEGAKQTIPIESNSANGSERTSVLASKLRILLRALPAFLKTSFLGTVAFESYDLAMHRASSSSSSSLARTACLSLGLGASIGLLHGTLFLSWDALYAQIERLRPSYSAIPRPISKPHIPGLLLAHMLNHASLFSVYETSKVSLFSLRYGANVTSRKVKEEEEEAEESHDETTFSMLRSEAVATVFLSASLAALVSEAMTHYSSLLEQHGIRNGIKKIRTHSSPVMREILPMMAPTALGFLAYEYSKPESIL